MPKFYVIDKNTGTKEVKDDAHFYLDGAKVVMIEAQRDNIASMTQNGKQLLIKLKSGELINIEDFFQVHDGQSSSLVINDTTPEGGGYWLVENPSTGDEWSQLNNLSSTMNVTESNGGIEPWMYWLGAGLSLGAIGGAIAINGHDSGHLSVAVNQIATPTILTNNKAGITGTGTIGSEVVLVKPDGTTEVAVVGKDGKWSFTLGGNPLNDGDKATIYARDPKNPDNKTEEISTVADKVVPDAPTVSENNATSLSGKAEADSKITLTKDDGTTASTTTDKDGNWSFKPNPLTDGKGGQIIATDAAGNASSVVDTGIADKISPEAPVVNINDASGLSGIAESGSIITLTKPDNTIVTTITGTDGKWSFKPNPLDNGEIGKFTASDKAGNVSDSSSSIATIDGPKSPVVIENNNTSLHGVAAPNAEITLKKTDGSISTTTADNDGKWSFEPNPLDNGQKGELTSKDSSGESAPISSGVADKIAPDSPIVQQNNKDALSGDSEAGATITITKSDGSTVTTVADANGKWSFSPNPLDNGESSFVHATDTAGNIGEGITTGVAHTLSPALPVVTTNNADSLSGTAEANTLITLTRTDGSVLTTSTDENGKWSFEPNPLSNGRSGEITATNDFSNQSDVTDTGIADKIAPTTPVITTNDASGITGKSEANATITLTKEDGSTITTVAENNGRWSFNPNPLDNGEQGTFTATDKAGNISESSSSTANISSVETQDENISSMLVESNHLDVSASNLIINQKDESNLKTLGQSTHLNTGVTLTLESADASDHDQFNHLDKAVTNDHSHQEAAQENSTQENNNITSKQIHDLLNMSEGINQQNDVELNTENPNINVNDLHLSDLLVVNHHLFYMDKSSHEKNEINIEDLKNIINSENSTTTNNEYGNQEADYGINDIVIVKEAGTDLLEALLINQQNF